MCPLRAEALFLLMLSVLVFFVFLAEMCVDFLIQFAQLQVLRLFYF